MKLAVLKNLLGEDIAVWPNECSVVSVFNRTAVICKGPKNNEVIETKETFKEIVEILNKAMEG
jgi:hypothetical protein